MNVKERILCIILQEKIRENPKHAKKIGLEVVNGNYKERIEKNEKNKWKN